VKIGVPFQEGKKYSLLSGRQTPSTGVDIKLVAAGRSNIAVLAQYKGEVIEHDSTIFSTQLLTDFRAKSWLFLMNKEADMKLLATLFFHLRDVSRSPSPPTVP
jgi:hypothetical protein